MAVAGFADATVLDRESIYCDGRMLGMRPALALVALPPISCGMTPQELIAFRARLGWGRAKLARRLGISPSRLADFERGCSHGRHSRPAPIPTVVELACRWLDEHEGGQRPLTPAERAGLWRDDARWPGVDHVIDDSRDAIYGDLPGGRRL